MEEKAGGSGSRGGRAGMCAPAAAGAAGDLGKSVLQLQVAACPVRNDDWQAAGAPERAGCFRSWMYLTGEGSSIRCRCDRNVLVTVPGMVQVDELLREVHIKGPQDALEGVLAKLETALLGLPDALVPPELIAGYATALGLSETVCSCTSILCQQASSSAFMFGGICTSVLQGNYNAKTAMQSLLCHLCMTYPAFWAACR